MDIQSIYLQQSEKMIQNSALRKAAISPAPPGLSDDESAMIQKKFASTRPIESYTMQGNIQKSSFFDKGLHFDKRV